MLVQAEIWTVAKTNQGNAILLRPMNSNVAVPIFIGHLEAQSILLGMGRVPMPRPNTHELLVTLLDTFHFKLTRIEITDIRDGIFYAALHLQSEETKVVQDSRPSDAIALAVRQRCPIFLSDDVVDEAGIALETIMEASIPSEEPFSDRSEGDLKEALEKAVREENYEEAARLRDFLESFDGQSPPSDEDC